MYGPALQDTNKVTVKEAIRHTSNTEMREWMHRGIQPPALFLGAVAFTAIVRAYDSMGAFKKT